MEQPGYLLLSLDAFLSREETDGRVRSGDNWKPDEEFHLRPASLR